MLLSRTKLLLFSILFTGLSCASDYRGLNSASVDQSCLDKVRPPSLSTSWYTASVDVVGKHISGLLLVKEMPDRSKRIVFTNEAGVTFFDFGFEADREFKIYSIIHQLNRKAVVRLLRDDFSLLLGIPFESPKWQSWALKNEKYFGVSENNNVHYLVTDQNCTALVRLESGSKSKKKISINLHGNDLKQPDSIALEHHTFAMKINLKKLHK